MDTKDPVRYLWPSQKNEYFEDENRHVFKYIHGLPDMRNNKYIHVQRINKKNMTNEIMRGQGEDKGSYYAAGKRRASYDEELVLRVVSLILIVIIDKRRNFMII